MNVGVGKYLIGQGQPIFIVGEIGINHNGNVSTAKRLIDIAVDAGCQAVKFQKRTVSVVYSEAELKKPREVPFEMMELAVRRGVCSPETLTRPTSDGLLETTNGRVAFYAKGQNSVLVNGLDDGEDLSSIQEQDLLALDEKIFHRVKSSLMTRGWRLDREFSEAGKATLFILRRAREP